MAKANSLSFRKKKKKFKVHKSGKSEKVQFQYWHSL